MESGSYCRFFWKCPDWQTGHLTRFLGLTYSDITHTEIYLERGNFGECQIGQLHGKVMQEIIVRISGILDTRQEIFRFYLTKKEGYYHKLFFKQECDFR